MNVRTAQDTRQRILAAAAEVFLEKGFEKATVREICARARANVAAVNYHFQDKRDLYHRILNNWMDQNLKRFPLDLGLEPGMSAQERLHAFVHSELLRLLAAYDNDQAAAVRRARLFLNELTADHPGSEILRRGHQTLFVHLRAIVAELLGPKAPEDVLDQCAENILGQCVHQMLIKLSGLDKGSRMETREDIRALARQMTTFCLGGIQAVRQTLS